MGTWSIEVRGTGSHHNKGGRDDAERLAAQFVQQLRLAGHTVRSATFALTSTASTEHMHIEHAQPGAIEDIGSAPGEYLAAKEMADKADAPAPA